MHESQVAQLRQIAGHLRQAQALYRADPPPAPGGILLGADLTSAAARVQALLNQAAFEGERAQKKQQPRVIFGVVRQPG